MLGVIPESLALPSEPAFVALITVKLYAWLFLLTCFARLVHTYGLTRRIGIECSFDLFK